MKQEHEAVESARNPKDVGVLIACLSIICVMIMIPLVSAWFLVVLQLSGYLETTLDEQGVVIDPAADLFDTIFVYVMISVSILLFTMIGIRMMRQVNLSNALQVEYSNYAWLRDWANQVAGDLDMPRVEIFVTQDPIINAYAFGFAKPYNIVLNSGSVRYLSHDELKAIVVHEMAHIKYHHTQISTYLSVFRLVPVAGALFSWILDFWSRRTELTADRLAVAYLKQPNLVKQALVKVHVGPDVAGSFSDITHQWQVYNTRGGFNQLTQSFSTHPFLVRRLQHIDSISGAEG